MSADRRDPGRHGPALSVLTPPGRGAVATIRVVGVIQRLDESSPPLFRPANGRRLGEQPLNRIIFGHWGTDTAEEVVVCRTDADTLELHCHGGDAAVRRIVGDLQSLGCQVRSWQEEAAGTLDAECLIALSQATTLRTAGILLEQASGGLRTALEELLQMEWTDAGRVVLRERLEELLSWSEFGLHLTQPWNVVLVGRPNVGKSSLINALLGYARAIVFDQPGTTRDVVTGETAFDGWPVQLADTAGLRDAAEALESAGIALARCQLATADCRLLLLDTSQQPHADDFALLAEWPDAIRLAHKSDLPNVWGERLPNDALPVSSVTGTGIDALIAAIVQRLVPRVPPPGTAIPITERQIELPRAAREALSSADERHFRQVLEACLTGSPRSEASSTVGCDQRSAGTPR